VQGLGICDTLLVLSLILIEEYMGSILRYLKATTIFKWIVYSYVRVLFYTYRLEVVTPSGKPFAINKSEGLFYVWHEHTISGLFFLHKMGALGHFVSDQSIEGGIAGFVARNIGLCVMYGNGKPSFMRRALEALEMNKRMYTIGDGDSGGAYELQREIPYLCARSGVPLVFLECHESTALSFHHRWDALKIPLPFSRVVVTVHEPRSYEFDQEHEPVEKSSER
jgi:lysophospholipid acyltransferase (LPLAT)-like uncharacterized protein